MSKDDTDNKNEQFQQIYNNDKANNMTDLDAQSFYDAYSDPEKFSELYGYVKGQNMTDLGQDEFYAAYFGELKKKDSPSELSDGYSSSVLGAALDVILPSYKA